MGLLRRLPVFALFALLLCSAVAQPPVTLTHVSLAKLLDGVNPVANGNVCFTPADGFGNPITVSVPGYGLVKRGAAFCQTVVGGAFPSDLVVPSACATNNPNPITYNIAIQEFDASGDPLGVPVVIPAVSGVCGASYTLDAYTPVAGNTTPVSPALGQGPALPSSCSAPSLYLQQGPPALLFSCQAGAYQQISTQGPVGATGAPGLNGQSGVAGPQGAVGPSVGGVNTAAVSFGAAVPVGAVNSTNNVPLVVNPAQGNNLITQNLAQVIGANHFFFSDGTDGWAAGVSVVPGTSPFVQTNPTYLTYGMFAFDIGATMHAFPSYFTPGQVKNAVQKFDGARNGLGEFPFAVAQDGTAAHSTFYSGFDNAHIHAIPEGANVAAQLTHLYFRETHDLSLYTSVVAHLKTALAIPPRSGSGLITVVPGQEYVPSTGFVELARTTGDNALANVIYFYSMEALAEMANAAGDSANLSFFNAQASSTQSAVISELTDSSTQLLKVDTGQLAANLDDIASSLACYPFDALSPMLGQTQCAAIANYFAAHASTLFYNGFMYQSPTPYAVIGAIPSSGGPPYTTPPNGWRAGQYDDGLWGFFSGWAMAEMKTVAPASVQSILASYVAAPLPGIEWYDRGSTPTPGLTAVNTLMTSPTGPKIASDATASTVAASGVCVLNMYGVCTGGGAGAGGLVFTSPDNTPADTGIAFNSRTAFPFVFHSQAASNAYMLNYSGIEDNIAPGNEGQIGIGQGFSNFNLANIGFHYTGNGSSSNYGSAGLYGQNDLIKWFANGNVSLGIQGFTIFIGGGGYVPLSFNNSSVTPSGGTTTGITGITANSNAAVDPSMYFDVNIGGVDQYRVNGVNVAKIDGNGFEGPIGAGTAAAGNFTTLNATSVSAGNGFTGKCVSPQTPTFAAGIATGCS